MKYAILKSICKFVSGGTPSKSVPEYFLGDIPWITGADIFDGNKVIPRSHITQDAIAQSSTHLVSKNTIVLVTRTGVGKVAITPYDLCFSQDITAISPNSELDLKYLFYFLKTQKSYFKANQRGATIKGITRKIVEDLKIPLPPLETQRRIAAVLEKADHLRSLRRQALARLDDLVQSVFLEMFGDPMTNPMGWEKYAIGNLTDVQTGSTPSRSHSEYYLGTIPWIKTTEIVGNEISESEEYLTEAGLKNSNCKLFPVNTILIAMYGQGKTRGRAGLLKFPATTNQACGAILPTNKILPEFLFTYLKLQYKELRSLGRGGSQPNLNLSMIKDFEIILPPLDLQNKFISILNKISKNKMKSTGQDLDNLFNSLMQKAFKGELQFAEAEQSFKQLELSF